MAKVSMEDLKPNSHKAKTRSNDVIATPKATGVKQVAKGVARKRSVGEKFRDAFIAEDAKTVKEYVIGDVIVPGIKNLTLNILHNSIDMIFTGRGTGRKNGGFYTNHNNYGGYYDNNNHGYSRNNNQNVHRSYTYEDFGFETSSAASDVLEDMRLYLDEYNQVSIATFNELAGITGDYTDNRYGWKSLADSSISYHNGLYYIDFPRPRDLKQ